MKLVKLLFFIFVLLFILGTASALVFGVLQPDATCIKPDRATVIPVTCISQSDSYYSYTVNLVGEDFMKLEDNQYLFFPKSNQKIPILVNTTNVEQGLYESNFSFCPLNLDKNATIAITYCETVRVSVNVSENCAELPPIVVEEPKLFGLIEFGTAKLVFNLAALFLILILFALLIGKRVIKKKHKK